jgi:hypothetical protein
MRRFCPVFVGTGLAPVRKISPYEHAQTGASPIPTMLAVLLLTKSYYQHQFLVAPRLHHRGLEL